ncbi:MAG: hypothetical protein LBN29_08120 [Mediterranea sp.]|jgi:hypothetical protein|nr:hypothetical protein [Mediterranea sp.]
MKGAITYCAICLLLLAACVHDDFADPPIAKLGEREVVFSVSIPRAGRATRALGESDESTVTSVDVLAFSYDAASDSYLYAYHSEGRETKGSGSGITFMIKAYILPVKQKFVVLANASRQVETLLGDVPAAGDDQSGMEKETFLARLRVDLTASGGQWNTGDGSGNYTPLPMWGESEGVTVSGSTQRISDTPIPLLRMLARIDVALSTDAPGRSTDVFRLTEACLYNYIPCGRVVPSATAYDGQRQRVTAPTLPINASTGQPYAPVKGPVRFTEVDADSTAMRRVIYALEAVATDEREKATCLVIGGRYSAAGRFDEAPVTYYRVDLYDKAAGTNMDVLRNHLYQVLITEVRGNGFDSPEEAFRAQSANLTAEVLQWSESGMAHIVFDGTSVLGVSAELFKFYRNEDRSEAVEDNILSVYTDYRSGDAASVSGWYVKSVRDAGGGREYTDFNDCWLKLRDESGSVLGIGRGADDANVGPSDVKSDLYLTFDALQGDDAEGRAVVITFAAGRLEYDVRVEQSEDYLCDIKLHYVNGDDLTQTPHELQNGDMLTFISRAGKQPGSKTIVLEVYPKTSQVTVIWNAMPDIPEFLGGASGVSLPTFITPQESGRYRLELKPQALSTADEKKNGRASVVTLLLEYGGNVVSRIFTLKQIEYGSSLEDVDSLYLMNGEHHLFKVKANAEWQAKVTSDPCGILRLHTFSGAANTVRGTNVRFEFNDFTEAYASHAEAFRNYQEEEDWTPGKGMAAATVHFYHIDERGDSIALGDAILRASPVLIRDNERRVPARAADPLNPVDFVSDPFVVEGGKTSYRWRVRYELTSSPSLTRRGKSGNALTLKNHRAYLTEADGSTKMPIDADGYSDVRPSGTSFRMRLQPVQFPNRQIPDIVARARLYLEMPDGSFLAVPNAVASVHQDELTPRPRVIWAPGGTNQYGTLFDDPYFNGQRAYMFERWGISPNNRDQLNANRVVCISQEGPPANETWGEITYVQIGFGDDTGQYPQPASISKYWAKSDIPVWLHGVGIDGRITQEQQRMPPGYTIFYRNEDNTDNIRVDASFSDKLVYRFLFGNFDGASYVITNPDFPFQNIEWVSTTLTNWPSTTIPIARNKNTGNAMLTIDPSTNILFAGEDELFRYMPLSAGINASTAPRYFLFANIVEYITNASDYGLLFSKLLVDGEPLNLWSAEWGENVYPY